MLRGIAEAMCSDCKHSVASENLLASHNACQSYEIDEETRQHFLLWAFSYLYHRCEESNYTLISSDFFRKANAADLEMLFLNDKEFPENAKLEPFRSQIMRHASEACTILLNSN